MIQISEPITVEKLLPLIQRLPKIEREQLRKSLEMDSTTWREEWKNIVAHFHDAFADRPEEDVVRDFEVAIAEVRCERT